jgi:predicted lipid-binding transport protein (Tim44 family)
MPKPGPSAAHRVYTARMSANAPGPFRRADEHLFHAQQIVADEERILDLGQQEADGVVAALRDRTAAELPGVDTGALRQVDQEFDDEAFRAIARETFLKVREARKLQNPAEAAELLSAQMQRELQDAISGDVAAHRHHLLALLTVQDAVIAGAQVTGGQEQVDVIFTISAIEEDVDDRSGQVLAGDTSARSWQERWRFTRDPGGDTSASDERHEISFDRPSQWLVAHRGWIVTHIERLQAS